MLKLLAYAIGVDRITWAEVVLALALSVVFYFFLVFFLSI